MRASDIIDELETFYKDGVEYRSLDRHLTDADVERWSNLCGWSRSQFFDEIARCLAHGYNASVLSFDFCDMVVNDLTGPVTNTSGPGPQVFWDVYAAFDEGEYYHGSNRNENPVEVYTNPAITRIVDAFGTCPVNGPKGLDRRSQTEARG